MRLAGGLPSFGAQGDIRAQHSRNVGIAPICRAGVAIFHSRVWRSGELLDAALRSSRLRRQQRRKI